MSDLNTRLRFNAVNDEATQFGYRIGVDLMPNTRPRVYRAYAHHHQNEPSLGQFLCNGASALEAAEHGVEILREVVAGTAKWPAEG